VRIRFAESMRRTFDDLRDTRFISRSNPGSWIPLTALGDVDLRAASGGITRLNGERANIIRGYTQNNALPIEVTRFVLNGLATANVRLPAGYALQVGGDQENQSEAEANLDIRIAQARLRESRAGSKAARAGHYPTVDAAGTAGIQRQSQNSPNSPQLPPPLPVVNPESDLYQIGFDAAWEIDMFGGVRRAVEAADARLVAAQADCDDIIRIVLAEVAPGGTEKSCPRWNQVVVWRH
jgi:hypothetical protein